MISQSDIRRIQEELGRLAIEAVRIDVDGFIEATEMVASPQALAAGIDPWAVASAGGWAETARLLKPFRDHAVARVTAIRREVAESDDNFVAEESSCPGCGERFVDRLRINEDGSVVCTTCARRYQLPGSEAGDA
jgi:formylmethanofuran dehydrogenase subunit E